MEVPFLCVSSIWSLYHKVSIVDQIEVSTALEFRDNIEISFYEKSEPIVELSLSWFSLILVSIDDIPLLVDLAVFVPNNEVSVFLVNSSRNIDNLSFLICDESTLHSEHLPPS
jgi:hypothetical protein